MAKLNLEKIRKRIEEIESCIKEIKKYASVPQKEFWKDRRNILSIEHLLLIAIEAVGAICVHILARKLKRGAESLSECFEILGKEKIIPKKLSEKLVKMARFRNILVHRYWEIDEKKVLKFAKENLKDFEKFILAIKKQIKIL